MVPYRVTEKYMPIYEYQCPHCQHRFELLQKISDPAPADCPRCAQPRPRKLVSSVAFRLKGAGWYETDFKSGDKKKYLVDGSDPDAGASKSAGADEGTGKDLAKDTDKKSGGGENKSLADGGSAPARGDTG